MLFTSPLDPASPARHMEGRLVVAAFLLLAALFVLFPQIDLQASTYFWQEGRWLGADNPWWFAWPYEYVPKVGRWLLVAILLLALFTLLPRFAVATGRSLRRHCAFLLCAAALGQGLLIDVALKDHLGRARPMQIQQLGGERTFTPAFVPSDQCARNCSFVSGHVGGAAFIMAFGWLAGAARRRAWLLASIVAAAYLGYTRVAQGGHFVSDAIFAWFATYFSLWLTEAFFRSRRWLR